MHRVHTHSVSPSATLIGVGRSSSRRGLSFERCILDWRRSFFRERSVFIGSNFCAGNGIRIE